jgi:hypothetical protein
MSAARKKADIKLDKVHLIPMEKFHKYMQPTNIDLKIKALYTVGICWQMDVQQS